MSLPKLTRRTFLKASAVAAAAATLSTATSPATCLAETDAPAATEVKRIRTTCRGCGKMECGVWVTVENGRAIKVEGDESAKQSNGNCCGKSQASIQAAYHPDRIRYPMKRTNPKGDSDPGWVRISWDEAFQTAADKFSEISEKYGWQQLGAMGGTSRMYGLASGPLMGPFGGVNYVSAAQICKGPRRMVGALTAHDSFHFMALEDRPLVYVQWGTDQTQSNYDNSCRSTVEAVQHAEKFISVDPRKSNCGKEADYHLALRPGSDGAMLMAWTRIVMEEELYDDLLVKRWTNAPYLYVEELEPTGWTGVKNNRDSRFFEVKTRLLKESDLVEGGDPKKFMVWDNLHDRLTYFDANEEGEHAGMWEGQTEHDIATTGWEYELGGWVPDMMPFPVDIDPALWGEFDVTLKDGRTVKAVPVFQKYWDEKVDEMTLEKAEELTGVDADLIHDACVTWATRIDPRRGNGGINIQLAPEQLGRATQNFRIAYNLIFMTGNFDDPADNRGETTREVEGDGTYPPYGGYEQPGRFPDKSNWEGRLEMCGAKDFPLTRWHTQWTDAHSVWKAAHDGDPQPMRGMTCCTGDFMNQSNATYAFEALSNLDFFLYIDLWMVPGTAVADIVMPAQHWLEIPGCPRVSQGAHGGIGAMQHCVEAPGEAKFEAEIVCGVHKAAGVPFYDPATGDAWDRPIEEYLDSTVVRMGGITWAEFAGNFQENGWIDAKEYYRDRFGTYRRYQQGFLRGRVGQDEIPGFNQPTMKCELWSTIMESLLEGNEEGSPLPTYAEPPLSPISTPELYEEYPFNMTTGRRIPVYFHSEHRQLPWCREQWPVPRMEINPDDARALGMEQGDWAWIESKWGKIRQTVDLSHGVKPGVINCEHTWWYPELAQADKGYGLSCVNCLVDRDAQDPLCGSSQLRAYPVKVYKATAENSPFGNPCPCGEDGTPIISDSSDPRLKEWLPTYEGRE